MRSALGLAMAAGVLLLAACGTDAASRATPTPGAGTLVVFGDGKALAVDGETGVVEDVGGPLNDVWYIPSPNGRSLLIACDDDSTAYIGADDTGLCAYGPNGYEQLVTSSDLARPGFTETDWGSLEASWRPDGKAVAFLVRERAAQSVYSSGDVYVLDLSPRSVRRVAEGAFAESRIRLEWAPDGSRIATVNNSTLGASGDALLVIDPATGDVVHLARGLSGKGRIEQYAWAPDSAALTFTYNDGSLSLYVASVDGTTAQRLTTAWPGTTPAWSPDGMWIAATDLSGGSAHVFAVRRDGSERRAVSEGLRNSTQPAWSPDGRLLAFEGSQSGAFNDNDLFVYNMGTGELRNLTVGPELALFPLITFSRDSRRIFFTADAPPCMEGCPPGRLFMVGVDGNPPPRRLTEELVSMILSWQP